MSGFEGQVDAIANAAMEAFATPGMSIAIVRDGRVVHCKGYGRRRLGEPEPVTEATNFAIASCTKAFTSTAVAMLVDEGRMEWDDPVRRHIPFFRLVDPVTDHLVTIADLLSHRTGLPRNDALWYGSTASREEIVRRACQLQPANPIRSRYEYNNLMYTAAGYAIGLASGMGYEGFIRRRIFRPLGMRGAVLSSAEAEAAADHASPHALDMGGQVVPIPRRVIDNVCPTGGIHAGARDMASWLRFQLSGGVRREKRLVSEQNLLATRTPAILSSDLADDPDLASVSAYAYGWQILDVIGVKVITHSGGIDGFSSETTLLPRQNAGICVLCNAGRPAPRAVRRGLIGLISGIRFTTDPLERTLSEEARDIEAASKSNAVLMGGRIDGTQPSRPLDAFSGRYSDSAYGGMEITVASGSLAMEYNGIRFSGTHFHGDTFLMRAPFVSAVENLSTVTFETSPDGSLAARWVAPLWETDRRFVRAAG